MPIASGDQSFVEVMTLIARATRMTADAMNAGQSSFRDSMRIESEYRKILSRLPKYYQFPESHVDPERDAQAVAAAHAKQPALAIQRVVIYFYIHHRLLKLHRLYMPRAFHAGTSKSDDPSGADDAVPHGDGMFAHSLRTCVESAEILLSCYSELVRADSAFKRMWALRMMLFDALSTLQIDLLHRIHEPLDEMIIRRQADVELGISLMEASTTLEKMNKFIPASIAAMRTLQSEEKTKRTALKRQQNAAARAQEQKDHQSSNAHGVPPASREVESSAEAGSGSGSGASNVDMGCGALDLSSVPGNDKFHLDLDRWLRDISGNMATQPGPNMGGAKLIDRLIEEMAWDW